MKKILGFSFLTLLPLLGSCTDFNDATLLSQSDNTTAQKNIRSVDDAIAIAANYANTGNVKSRTERHAVASTVTTIYSSKKGRSADDVLYYVVNYDDNQGFAVVGAPLCVPELIAITESGTYNDPENLKNESFHFAMNAVGAYIEAMAINPPDGPDIPIPIDTTLAVEKRPFETKIGPHVRIQWNQAWPENMYAINHVAGCYPVALAQAFTYLKPFTELQLTFEGRDTDILIIDWDIIKKHHTSGRSYILSEADLDWHYTYCPLEKELHKDIGRLVRQCGEITGATYDIIEGEVLGRTHTEPTFADIGVRKFLGPCLAGYGTLDLIKKMGTKGIAIMNSSNPPHTWLADGYSEIGYYLIVKEPGASGNDEITKYSNYYLHYNWGYSGDSNGYFLEDIFDPTKAYKYDNTINTGNIVYGGISHAVYSPK